MILDEATSSIDTRTEEVVQAGMDNLMKGRTVFVIAHRLSTVRNSDVIMVLDHGNIIERGSHDDLIAQRGRVLPALYRRGGTGVAKDCLRQTVMFPRHCRASASPMDSPPDFPLNGSAASG